jgi:transketolase
MTPEHRLLTWQLHESQRGWFSRALYIEMMNNENIWILTADLGYKVLDAHRDDFSERFVNFGASEQTMVGAAVGLALSGKIPVCYSITSFLLYRPFEWIRNYVNHERIPVHLVGSGLDDDYAHDGFTHHTWDARKVLSCFQRIEAHFPIDKTDVPDLLNMMVNRRQPSFLCLRR